MTLEERARSVGSLQDLVSFVAEFRADYAANSEEWSNCDLSAFLDALAAWCSDMDGYYANMGEDLHKISPWRVVADMLMAARIYE
jgi:hypothetical protein